jgi:hypothetical protein
MISMKRRYLIHLYLRRSGALRHIKNVHALSEYPENAIPLGFSTPSSNPFRHPLRQITYMELSSNFGTA